MRDLIEKYAAIRKQEVEDSIDLLKTNFHKYDTINDTTMDDFLESVKEHFNRLYLIDRTVSMYDRNVITANECMRGLANIQGVDTMVTDRRIKMAKDYLYRWVHTYELSGNHDDYVAALSTLDALFLCGAITEKEDTEIFDRLQEVE